MRRIEIEVTEEEGDRIDYAMLARHGEDAARAAGRWLREQTLLHEAEVAREAVLSNTKDAMVIAIRPRDGRE